MMSSNRIPRWKIFAENFFSSFTKTPIDFKKGSVIFWMMALILNKAKLCSCNFVLDFVGRKFFIIFEKPVFSTWNDERPGQLLPFNRFSSSLLYDDGHWLCWPWTPRNCCSYRTIVREVSSFTSCTSWIFPLLLPVYFWFFVLGSISRE